MGHINPEILNIINILIAQETVARNVLHAINMDNIVNISRMLTEVSTGPMEGTSENFDKFVLLQSHKELEDLLTLVTEKCNKIYRHVTTFSGKLVMHSSFFF